MWARSLLAGRPFSSMAGAADAGKVAPIDGEDRTLRAALWVLAAALSWLFAAPAHAGYLSRADLERAFPAPYALGERDDRLPVWPIFKQNATETELVAYVFESVDLAPIPGFSGTPIDLLVALTPEGSFLDRPGVPGRLGLIAEDGDERRRVDDHRGNPRSSYSKSA